MTYRRFTAGPEQVIDKLNNAKVLGPFPRDGLAVGGRTLSVGGTDVTFPGEDGANVSFGDILAALRDNGKGTHFEPRSAPGSTDRYISVYGDEGVTLGKGGTANEAFGLSTKDDTKTLKPIPMDNIKAVSRITPAEYEVIAGGPDSAFEG